MYDKFIIFIINKKYLIIFFYLYNILYYIIYIIYILNFI